MARQIRIFVQGLQQTDPYGDIGIGGVSAGRIALRTSDDPGMIVVQDIATGAVLWASSGDGQPPVPPPIPEPPQPPQPPAPSGVRVVRLPWPVDQTSLDVTQLFPGSPAAVALQIDVPVVSQLVHIAIVELPPGLRQRVTLAFASRPGDFSSSPSNAIAPSFDRTLRQGTVYLNIRPTNPSIQWDFRVALKVLT